MILGGAFLGYVAFANYSTYYIARLKSREVWEEEGRDGCLPVKLKSMLNKSQVIIVDPLLLLKLVVLNSWFLTYEPGRLFASPYLATHLLMSESRALGNGRANSAELFFSTGFYPAYAIAISKRKGRAGGVSRRGSGVWRARCVGR